MTTCFSIYYHSQENGVYLQEAIHALPQCQLLNTDPLANLPSQLNGVDVILLEYQEANPILDRWIQKTTGNPKNPAIFLCVPEISVNELLKAIHLGVRECLALPVREEDLQEALDRLPRKASEEEQANFTRIAVFLGCKGGVGTTFITANVAYLMAQAGKGKVLVVDLDLHYGQLAQFFDLHPKHTIMEVIENLANLDSAYVQSVLPIYHDNLYILPAPSRIEEAETVTPEHLGKILSHIRQLEVFRWILVDGGCQLRDVTLKAMELSEEIILVASPSVPALANARRLLELLKVLGLEGATWRFLLNSWNKKSNVTLEEVEKFLDWKIAWVVGNDMQTVNRSIDEGRPLAEMGPQLPISQDLSRVAGAFLDPAAADQKVSVWQRLWRWLQGGKP